MADGDNRQHDCRPCCLTHVRIPFVKGAVGVTGAPRALLWVFSVVHADKETGQCWPGVGTMAAETGLSRWSVSRAVEQLVQIGAIKAEREHRKATRYTINFEKDPATFRSSVLPKPRGSHHRVGSSVHPTSDDVGSTVHQLGADCTKLVACCGANRGGERSQNGVPHPSPETPEPPPDPGPGGPGRADMLAWIAEQEARHKRERVDAILGREMH